MSGQVSTHAPRATGVESPRASIGQPAVRVIGAVVLRAVVGVLAMIMLMVLLVAWTPGLVDPLLRLLGL
jgi:hypothetical protein